MLRLDKPFVKRQVAGKLALPFLGVQEGNGIGQFLVDGLEKPLRLAVASGF